MWNYTYKSWYFDWERPHALNQGYWYLGTGVSFNIYCRLRGKKKKTYVDVINHHFNPPGGNLYFRLDIILVKGLSKHTLNTYFSGKKIDPKYAFFACVFLNFPYVLSKIVNMTKNTPFFPFLHVFAPLNDVSEYIAWSWKTTLITWFFLRGWYPTLNTSALPPGFQYSLPMLSCQIVEWLYRSS